MASGLRICSHRFPNDVAWSQLNILVHSGSTCSLLVAAGSRAFEVVPSRTFRLSSFFFFSKSQNSSDRSRIKNWKEWRGDVICDERKTKEDKVVGWEYGWKKTLE